MRKNVFARRLTALTLLLCLLVSGCGQSAATAEELEVIPAEEQVQLPAKSLIDLVEMQDASIENEAVALAAMPALPDSMTPKASGTLTKQAGKAVIDYSNTADGYVMTNYTGSTNQRLKVQVKGPVTKYTYNIKPGEWTTFPLSDGNGSYTVGVYENVSGTKYSTVVSATFTVTLKDEFAPFTRPNQYVDYAVAPNTVAKAAELTNGITDPLKKVEAVYKFVVGNFTYDTQLAATVQSGYLPVLDTVLSKKSGICFDYAAVMTGMLRSQGVPCKLVVGYAGQAYHAWISVWTAEAGWIDSVISFDGKTWQRMDPTFASSAGASAAIMKYIGDGSNYSAKYFY